LEYIKREKISTVSVLVGALLVRFYVIPNYIEITEDYDLASLSPAFFPILATWVIAGLAALNIALTFLRGKRRTYGGDGEAWLSPGEERKAYLSALVIIGYFVAMKLVGFLISTILLLAILFLLQGVKGPLKVAITSLSVTAGIYLFFLYVMKVHFPIGLIFE